MKTKNITFSMPIEVVNLLHSKVEQHKQNEFVAQAIQEALTKRMNSLKAAYAAAEGDPDRLETIKDWAALDSDGSFFNE